MSEIKLHKRVKFAGDVHAELLKLGLDCETAALFCDNIPDADAVEVVRCKDCKYGNERFNCHTCSYWFDGYVAAVDPYGYCSYGERREDNAPDVH